MYVYHVKFIKSVYIFHSVYHILCFLDSVNNPVVHRHHLQMNLFMLYIVIVQKLCTNTNTDVGVRRFDPNKKFWIWGKQQSLEKIVDIVHMDIYYYIYLKITTKLC